MQVYVRHGAFSLGQKSCMELASLNDRFHVFSKKGNYISGFGLFVINGNCFIRMQKLPFPYFLSS